MGRGRGKGKGKKGKVADVEAGAGVEGACKGKGKKREREEADAAVVDPAVVVDEGLGEIVGFVKGQSRRITEDGDKQVCVKFANPGKPPQWISQVDLPEDLHKKLNPKFERIAAEGLEEHIKVDWVGQALQATSGEQSKEFSYSKWAGADKAEMAAVKWVQKSS